MQERRVPLKASFFEDSNKENSSLLYNNSQSRIQEEDLDGTLKSPTFQNLIHTELTGDLPDMFQNAYCDSDEQQHFVSVAVDDRVPGKISKIK